MTDKQKKEEIKQVVTNLANIEFTVEDELKFCKEVLKRKEQECEEWKSKYYSSTTEVKADLIKQLDQLKKENEQLKKSVKSNKDKRKRAIEKYDQLKVENDALKKSILQECPNCREEYLNYKGVELYDENHQLKQALQEIKQLTIEAKTKQFVDMEDFWEQILQKCEVVDE